MATRCPQVIILSSVSSSSSSSSSVFEDTSSGIICYRDENGEIVCEGYDEGPRFHQKILPTSCNPNSKEAEIIALLQKNWYILIEGIEFENGRKVLAPEGFDLNLNLN
ncbi:hypothetical protein RJ641_019741, partial [Dillenia turbinata]